jgi:hypothetical protein
MCRIGIKTIYKGDFLIFSGWTLIMAKKINHRGHGGHRELLFSLCPLWFSKTHFQKIIKWIK